MVTCDGRYKTFLTSTPRPPRNGLFPWNSSSLDILGSTENSCRVFFGLGDADDSCSKNRVNTTLDLDLGLKMASNSKCYVNEFPGA